LVRAGYCAAVVRNRVSDNPAGKDGIGRNAARFRLEIKLLRREMSGHWRRWLRRPWDVHAYVNLWVESARIAPYLVGHVYCVLVPALLAAALL
jgi:hypothetical protein